MKPSAATRAQMSLFNPPADLFYGELILENTSTSNHMEEQELSVSRMVASMNITIRGLELLGESNRGVYSFVVHVNPEKPDVPLNKNDAFQKVQKRRVQEKR
ncbi:FimB/Mfa2 family fimbrial subunit [Bacteroides fragilis]